MATMHVRCMLQAACAAATHENYVACGPPVIQSHAVALFMMLAMVRRSLGASLFAKKLT